MSKPVDPREPAANDSDAASDPVLRALGASLVGLDVDRIAAQRILVHAREALARPPRPALRWLGQWLEPALVTGLAAGYLVWAFGAVIAVYR